MTHWALAAAKALRNLIEAIPHTKGPLGTEHLLSMLDRMDDSMSVGKLNRWLGWIQASVVAHGFSDLDHMKAHNKHFSDEQKSAQKEYPTCDRCGSPNVSADAAARWDYEKQDWTITNVFDKGHSCDDCGDECRIEWEEGDYPEALATALPHLSTAREVVKAWQQGYHQGVQDERTSEANIGIAGFGAKVEPARINPYLAQRPAPVDGTLLRELRGHEVERLLRKYAAQHDKTSPRMAQMMELGARAVAALAAQPGGSDNDC